MIRIVAVIMVVSTLASWLVYRFPEAAISPGELFLQHQQTSNSCLDCHEIFLGVSGEKCLSCHEQTKIGLYTVDGNEIKSGQKRIRFHRYLGKDTCISCHTEHKGKIPLEPITGFSHEILTNEDLQDCVSCHEKPTTAIHQKIDQNCRQCHTTDNWEPSKFDHQKYFRFDKHHDEQCTSCHIDAIYTEYTCYGCHEHSLGEIKKEHVEEGIREFENCVTCHRSGDEDEAERIWKSMKRRSGINIKKRDKKHRYKSREDRHRSKKHSKDDRHEDDD